MSRERGISTVADVSFAILLIVAAMAVLVALSGQEGKEHDPVESDRTAEVLASSTINTTYSVETAFARAASDEDVAALTDLDFEAFDDHDKRRITHGPIATHLADIAVANVSFDGQRLTREAVEYEQRVEAKLQSGLVESSFETSVTAVWTPYEGAGIGGTTELGETPPPHEDVGATTMTVPSGMPPVREDALVAAENGYTAVAQVLAEAIVAGYLPQQRSQRALESSGVARVLTVYRYLRLETVLGGALLADQDLHPGTADAARANNALADALASDLTDRLRTTFDSPEAAAATVSTGEVTITVRTWEP